MHHKVILFLLAASVLICFHPADAQQPAKIPRIGYLAGQSLSNIATRTEAFRQGLRELGYVEGKNIVIEWRSAEGKLDRLPALAAELVRLKVDVIVTSGSGVNPCRQGSNYYDSHCHGAGSRSCWQRVRRQPCATWRKHYWIVNSSPELSGKQLELLKEIVPKLSRVAVFGTSTSAGTAQMLRETELAAGALGVKLQYLDV